MTSTANRIPTGVKGRRSASVQSVTYVGEGDELVTVTPTRTWARTFWPYDAVRRIHHYHGIENTPGAFYFASSDRMIDYESWLERRWLQLLDFDPTVTDVCTQPLTVAGLDRHGPIEYTADIFARLADGGGRLIEVKNPQRLLDPEVQRRARLGWRLGRQVGWDFHLLGDPPPVVSANVAWLAGYRRPVGPAELADTVLGHAGSLITVKDLWERTGDSDLVKAVTFHLMWHHELEFDLTRILNERTRVVARS